MKQLYLACALITDTNGRMLAVRKRKSIFFQMAGGKIDKGETAEQTLARECLEELCLDISSTSVAFLGEHSAMAVNEANTQVNAHVFHVSLKEDVLIEASAEIEEIVWLTKNNYKTIQLAHLLEEFSLPIWLQMPSDS